MVWADDNDRYLSLSIYIYIGLISYAVLSLITEGMDHGVMWTLLGLVIGCVAMVCDLNVDISTHTHT